MGLIKAALGSAGGVMADQWKEYFYCEAIPATVLAVKGRKRASGRSSNTKGSDNIITSGSVIAVADGQCMMIVEQGKVVEVCAEPGEFTFDASTEPSIFSGDLGESIGQVFQNIGKRFTFGGEAPIAILSLLLYMIPHMQIFFSGSQSTADMALGLVQIQDLPRLRRQSRIYLKKSFCAVFMYRRLRYPKLLCCLPYCCLFFNNIICYFNRPFLNIIFQGKIPRKHCFYNVCWGFSI